MPLTLVGKSLLIQTRPSGERDSIDLDQVLANFDGSFALVGDGKGRFSRSAQLVRVEGGRLVAILTRSDKSAIQVAFDLEKSGIVTDSGLALPATVSDPACQTILPFAKRSSLASGRPTRRLRLAVDNFDRDPSSNAAFRMANASEQRALYFLAKAERELLHAGSGRKCRFARILPGWIEGDAKKLRRDERADKFGFVRDFNALVRDIELGSAPANYAACFAMARDVVYESLDSFRDNARPGLVECHIRDAVTHIQRSLAARRSQLKRDEAFSVVDRATWERRTAFYNDLREIAQDLATLISAATPGDRILLDPTIVINKSKGRADNVPEAVQVDDDYDLEDADGDSVTKGHNPFRD